MCPCLAALLTVNAYEAEKQLCKFYKTLVRAPTVKFRSLKVKPKRFAQYIKLHNHAGAEERRISALCERSQKST